jgi:hypothetical protein
LSSASCKALSPGGHFTGVSLAYELSGKRRLIREVLPGVKRSA